MSKVIFRETLSASTWTCVACFEDNGNVAVDSITITSASDCTYGIALTDNKSSEPPSGNAAYLAGPALAMSANVPEVCDDRDGSPLVLDDGQALWVTASAPVTVIVTAR